MMSQFLIRRIETQSIEYAIRVSTVDPDATGPFDPSNPAPTVPPMVEPGCEGIPYEGDISILARQPTPTSVLEWDGTGPVWVEHGDLLSLIAAAIEQSKANVNSITALAIGNLVNEYMVAALDARAFAAAGFTGQTTSYVTSYAVDNETNVEQTPEWAARAIIARADAFESAQEQMRSKRFNFQRAMRNSTTPAQLAHVVYLWNEFIADLRVQLGL